MDVFVRSRIDAWLARRVKDYAVNEHDSPPACLGTALGNVRGENQDRAAIARFTSQRSSRSFLLFSVCDGLGGMQDGARCARLALAELVSTLIHYDGLDSKHRLLRAVSSANTLVTKEYRGRGGTTLSAILVDSNGQAWGTNVGDSRIYQYVPRQHCKQISIDDTIAGQVQHLRGISTIEIDRSHFSDHLAQYIGIGEELEPHTFDIDISTPEYRYLLTSDGAHGPLSSVLTGLAIHAASSEELVRRILHLSKWTGGYDNASAIAFGPVPKNSLLVERTLNRDLVELWDPYSKLDLVVPTYEFVDQKQSTDSLPPDKPPVPQMTTKKKRAPKKKKKAMQQTPEQANKEAMDETPDPPQLDIAVFNEAGVLDKKLD